MKTQYKAGRAAPFIQVPVALLSDHRTDAFTIAAYVALRSFCNFGSEAGAFPSDTAAAARAGMSSRTFRERRTRLRDMGWVEWDSGKEDGKPNRYIVHATLEEEGRQEVPTPSAAVADPGRQELPTTYIQSTIDSVPTKYEEALGRWSLPISDIWAEWINQRKEALGIRSRTQKVTWRRVRGVLVALDELGYSVDECKDVIRGCCSRPHNVQGGFLDIELMFRDQQHIELYLHHWRSNGNGNGKVTTTDTQKALEAMYG